jgi:hypothetical protein
MNLSKKFIDFKSYKMMGYAKYRQGDVIYIINSMKYPNEETYITNSVYYDKIYTL